MLVWKADMIFRCANMCIYMYLELLSKGCDTFSCGVLAIYITIQEKDLVINKPERCKPFQNSIHLREKSKSYTII